eukprot:176862_1
MLLTEQGKETKDVQFFQPAAIAIATNPNDDTNKKKYKPKTNRKKKSIKDPNYNPLLPENEKPLDEPIPPKPTFIHSFTLTTNTSKTTIKKQTKCYNIYCMLLLSNIFLIGSFLLFIHNYIVDAIGILLIIIGFILNLYTIWTFCGEKLCPKVFKHENILRFSDTEKTVYILWNSLIKQTTINYDEFARLYIEDISNNTAVIYIATSAKHYRFNKYLSNMKHAKEFVAKVNNWWNVDRLLEIEKRNLKYHNIVLNNGNNDKKEEQIMEKTKEEIYMENEAELKKLIKKLKYKSFGEKDIENGCKLKQFFGSRYKTKMIEEYENIKMELDNKRKNGNIEELVILENANKYISEALVLKFETLDQLIEKRKMDKLQMMINENKRNKIVFDNDDNEQKFDTLEDEMDVKQGNVDF